MVTCDVNYRVLEVFVDRREVGVIEVLRDFLVRLEPQDVQDPKVVMVNVEKWDHQVHRVQRVSRELEDPLETWVSQEKMVYRVWLAYKDRKEYLEKLENQ